MKKTLLLAVVLLGLPAVGLAHDVHFSDNSSFEVEGDELVITREHRRGDDEVVVSRDGDLTINGERIEVGDGERKDLKKLYREAVKLEEMAEKIGAEAARIAEASSEFAAAQVAAALRSLRDDDAEVDEDEMEKIEIRFEAEVEQIEKFAEKIEEQADEVVELAEDLQDRIPALGELRWFLDD